MTIDALGEVVGLWRRVGRLRNAQQVVLEHDGAAVVTALEASEMSLPPRIQEGGAGRARRGGEGGLLALSDVFGEHALVHRGHRHKQRNVCDLLPERDRDQVRARIKAAWSLTDPELARQRLELLASKLDRTSPDAAGSLREGIHDTLTLIRLEITGKLATTLCSTTPAKA